MLEAQLFERLGATSPTGASRSQASKAARSPALTETSIMKPVVETTLLWECRHLANRFAIHGTTITLTSLTPFARPGHHVPRRRRDPISRWIREAPGLLVTSSFRPDSWDTHRPANHVLLLCAPDIVTIPQRRVGRAPEGERSDEQDPRDEACLCKPDRIRIARAGKECRYDDECERYPPVSIQCATPRATVHALRAERIRPRSDWSSIARASAPPQTRVGGAAPRGRRAQKNRE